LDPRDLLRPVGDGLIQDAEAEQPAHPPAQQTQVVALIPQTAADEALHCVERLIHIDGRPSYDANGWQTHHTVTSRLLACRLPQIPG